MIHLRIDVNQEIRLGKYALIIDTQNGFGNSLSQRGTNH